MARVLMFVVSFGARAVRAVCRCRADLVVENLALRQQVTALKKERPRPPLDDVDRAFCVALRHSWPAWTSRLLIVNPDTVTRWHRDPFRRTWATISQRVDAEIRRLIRRMAQNGWRAPRIHAELKKLGFSVAEKTVSRYLPRRPTDPDQLKRWIAFLRNHKDDIAAMDLFTLPTASLRVLYGFFVIEHGRRHIVHFNATFHPCAYQKPRTCCTHCSCAPRLIRSAATWPQSSSPSPPFEPACGRVWSSKQRFSRSDINLPSSSARRQGARAWIGLIACSGCYSRGYGPTGTEPSRLSRPTPSCAGTGAGLRSTGDGNQRRDSLVDRPWPALSGS